MKLSFFSLTIVFVVIVYLQNSTQGQLFKSTGVSQEATKPDEEHDPFQTRIMLGLGLGGVEKNLDFVMVDENGFEFDTMSLLKHQNVRDSIEMDEAQYSELYEVWEDRKRELTSKFQKDALDLVEAKRLSKAMFLEGEVEMRELLSEDQLLGLEQARVQLAIQRHGAAAALGASDVREQLGLTKSDIALIKEGTGNLDEQVSEFRKSERQSANELLIDKATELAESEQAIDHLFDEKLMTAFLESELFRSDKPTKNPSKSRSSVTRLVKLGSVRKEAKISDEQFEEIKALKSNRSDDSTPEQVQNQIEEILTNEQLTTLTRIVIKRESSKLGTVSASSNGVLARTLKLSDESKRELFDFGVELQESLNEKIVKHKSELIVASMSEIPESRRKVVAGFLKSARTSIR